MTSSRRYAPVLSFLLLASHPALAADAQPDAKRAEAAQRFDRGLTLFDEGDNAGALAEFKRTYELMPNPAVLYNIGLVYAAMGRAVDAVDALEKVADGAGLSKEQIERSTRVLAEQKARIARLMVTTVPEGARVEVDNVEVAKTPLTAPIRITEGSHIVGAVAEGYAPSRKEVVIAGNSDATIALELVPTQGKQLGNLTVRTRLAGADVVVDGQVSGKTPLATSITLVAGHHKVELKRPGYITEHKEVDIGEGATGELSFQPQVDSTSLGAEGATLALNVSESSAVVFVDEQHLGVYHGPLRLPRGPHYLRVEAGGFLPFERQIELEQGKANPINVELEPTAETRAAHDRNVSFHRTWGWIGVISGAVIAGGGGAWLLVNKSKKDDAKKELDFRIHDRDLESDPATKASHASEFCNFSSDVPVETCNAWVDEAQSAYDDKKKQDIIGYVGLGVGGAALATGVILLLTGEDADRFDKKTTTTASRANDKPRFTIVPGPGQAGLGLGAVF